jgi:hypothetical protein
VRSLTPSTDYLGDPKARLWASSFQRMLAPLAVYAASGRRIVERLGNVAGGVSVPTRGAILLFSAREAEMDRAVVAVALVMVAVSTALAQEPTVILEGGPLFGVQFSEPIDPATSASTFGDRRLEVAPPGDPKIGGSSGASSNSGIFFGSRIELEVGSGAVRDECSDPFASLAC